MKQSSTIFQQEQDTIDFIKRTGLSVGIKDILSNSWWVSNKVAQLSGYSHEVLMESPNSWEELIFADDKQLYQEGQEKCLAGRTVEIDYRINHASGDIVWIRDCSTPEMDESGRVISISSIFIDLSDQKWLEEKLKKSEEQFQILVDSTSNAILVHKDEEILYSNKVAKEILGSEINGTSLISFIHSESRNLYKNQLTLVEKGGTIDFSEYRVVKPDGSDVFVKCKSQMITYNNNPAIMTIAIDITQQVESERVINHLASHDYLTGLPNRNLLKMRLENEIIFAIEKGYNGAVLFIDLDRFKVINDNLSHSTGDSLLMEVAKRLQSLVAENDSLFRQGGDEFIIVLPKADYVRAKRFAHRIMDILSEPFTVNGEEIYITSSLGISLFPKDGKTTDTIIKHAEIAMYEAKNAGKKNYKFFSHVEEDEMFDMLKIEMGLYKAIENNEFFLQYQPKVNLSTGRVVGMEALIRWNHPEWGIVPPNSFIHIAEETGLIIPIGKWALYEACSQAKLWQQKGIKTTISVNLSPKQFMQSDMVQTIAEVLHHTRLKPEFLEIEITESMTADIDYTISTLNELKYLGVRISIDDFGTGFSSLNYLKEFPVDTLKIDQSFVRQLHVNPKDKTMVKTIISMAHNLNLNVVAEGIETKEQFFFLQEHFCNDGQGYLFSKPKHAHEIEKVIVDIERLARSQVSFQ